MERSKQWIRKIEVYINFPKAYNQLVKSSDD